MRLPPVAILRDLRLDLFRDLALLLIFLDHIPSNIVSWITIRNYGFSDATEIFVFVSGYANAYVYGAVIRQRGLVDAAASILKSAWQIYLAQILLLVIYIAEIAYVAGGSQYYTEEMNLRGFLEHPDVAMLQALLLKFRPVNLDNLLLYVVLLLGFPPFLWLLSRVRHWPWQHRSHSTLCASIGLESADLSKRLLVFSIRSPGSSSSCWAPGAR